MSDKLEKFEIWLKEYRKNLRNLERKLEGRYRKEPKIRCSNWKCKYQDSITCECCIEKKFLSISQNGKCEDYEKANKELLKEKEIDMAGGIERQVGEPW